MLSHLSEMSHAPPVSAMAARTNSAMGRVTSTAPRVQGVERSLHENFRSSRRWRCLKRNETTQPKTGSALCRGRRA